MAVVELRPRTPLALDRARDKAALKAANVFKSKTPPRDSLSLRIDKQTQVFGEGTKDFPVGTKVFDNHTGVEGIVVGRWREGVLGRSRPIVQTKPTKDSFFLADARDLAILARAPKRQPKQRELQARSESKPMRSRTMRQRSSSSRGRAGVR